MEPVSSSPPRTQTERSFEQPQQQQLAPLGAPVNRNAQVHAHQEIESHPPEDPWVVSIKLKLEATSQDYAAVSRKTVSIYRVPDRLKDPSRTMVYTPQVVSIGPYHHGTAPLQKMERRKWLSLQRVLERSGQDIKLYLDSMKELEPSVRACYAEKSELTSNQFVEMMLLDGCFMLEILQSDVLRKRRCAKDDPIFSILGASSDILRDMTMLENQIPLFILDKLLGLQPKNSGGEPSALVIADRFLDNLIPLAVKATKGIHYLYVVREKYMNGSSEPLVKDGQRQKLSNCAAVLRNVTICMLRKRTNAVIQKKKKKKKNLSRESEDNKREMLNYCAIELRNAGIKLRKGDHDKPLRNIEFKNRTLYIPQIQIDDGFNSLFSNLIAFEQCHLNSGQQHITSYVSFLDELIDSPEDVRCLRHHKIIENGLGSDAEVAHIINSLCRDVVFTIEHSYLSQLSYRINKYRNQTWNIWRATLKERYFNSPWAFISFVAAAILLILTATQTLYAIYSYYRPNN